MNGDFPKGDRVGDPLTSESDPARVEDSLELPRTILRCSNRGLSRIDFLQEASEALLNFSGCDAVEVRLNDRDLHYRWESMRRPKKGTNFELVRWTVSEEKRIIPALPGSSDLERFCRQVACREIDPALQLFTRNGSFFVGDTWRPLDQFTTSARTPGVEAPCIGGHYRSLAVVRFIVDDQTIGLLSLKKEQPDFFSEKSIQFYEGVAQTFGLAVADRRAEAALRELVKELTCLYGIAQIVEHSQLATPRIFQEIVKLLPPSWQFPEITAARIVFDDASFATPSFRESTHQQSAAIVVGGCRRGVVNVVYLEDRPEFSAGAFLPEEEKLIGAVAREISLIVDQEEAQAERAKLQNQLVHADRLATIGQLAAGVAHELNEPLGSILGFAQLIGKCPDLPSQAREDTDRIIRASLYAREVIKKLLVFARQMPSNVAPVDFNRVISDGLYFLEARCAKSGIDVVRDFAEELPQINADPARLQQILINLVVNAVHAMPDGGTLSISTGSDDESVHLIVEDTGMGMSEEILDKIFLPFFTTKDVDEGTGLGLAVVHGIVASHGGSINAESREGEGTRFTVRLPIEPPAARDTIDHGEPN